jgi:tetratricopeptide (TPR) repeat protein
MPDLYLQALMHGEILKKSISPKIAEKKNRFELETEKAIQEHIATLSFDEQDPNNNRFTTPEMKRARIKAELREQAKVSELSHFIGEAFKIITSEGKNFLGKEKYDLMNQDFAFGQEALEEIDLNIIPTENFQSLLHFSESTINSIFEVAVAKFNESQYPDSLALFIFLTTLNPENADFWHRAGILAQKCENYELAARLYSAAEAIDPSLLAPWVFSIDCYLKQDKRPEALSAYDEAMKIGEASEIQDEWKEMLSCYKAILIQA